MKRKYLIVDDDRISNFITRLIITKFEKDVEIHIFTEPEEGLKWIQKNGPGKSLGQVTLLLDINMPTMTGWGFLDEFITFTSPVENKFDIFILTSSIEDFSDKAVKYPFISGFFSKPLALFHLEKIHLLKTKPFCA